MTLMVEPKQIVVPGEVLADDMDYLPAQYAYRAGKKIIAKRTGVVDISGRAIRLIPLSGRYLPKIDDKIVVQIVDITMNGWLVDINSAYRAMLNSKDIPRFVRKGEDLTQYYDVGDYLRVRIFNVTSQNVVDVTMKEPGLQKMDNGRVIRINPHKVPRVIGKQGSMVTLIKDKTQCNITVGQNGVVWLKGPTPESEIQTVRAIRKIEEEAHLEGLTERMTAYLAEAQ